MFYYIHIYFYRTITGCFQNMVDRLSSEKKVIFLRSWSLDSSLNFQCGMEYYGTSIIHIDISKWLLTTSNMYKMYTCNPGTLDSLCQIFVTNESCLVKRSSPYSCSEKSQLVLKPQRQHAMT